MVSMGHTETDDDTETDCAYCSLLDNGIPHHDSYADLEAASDSGCVFCGLIRQSLIDKYAGKNSISEGTSQGEADRFCGPVIFFPFNPTAHFPFKDEPPRIEIRVGFASRLRTDPYLTFDFEAFAPRGMPIQGSSNHSNAF
jgi:hypothetical protein